MILADINEILDWPVGLEGWHIDPKTGASAKIGNLLRLGHRLR